MRVLVVEDHGTLADRIAQGFRQAGMAVDAVYDGAAALDAAAQTDYDVIVPNNHVARYERKDWEGNYLTFFNPGAGPVTFNVLVGRPVPDFTLVAI